MEQAKTNNMRRLFRRTYRPKDIVFWVSPDSSFVLTKKELLNQMYIEIIRCIEEQYLVGESR